MRNLKSASIAGFLAFVGSASALAGNLEADVVPTASSVSLSVGGSQPVASISVKLTNVGTNAMNIARLVGTTTVVNGGPAVYHSSDGASCATTNGGTKVDCNVGGLLPGPANAKTFTVSFKSPTSGSAIKFAWDAVFDNGAPPGGSNGEFGEETVTLTAPSTEEVVSSIPPNQAVTIFTGTGTVASEGDPWVTILKAPAPAQGSSVSSVATVVETASGSQCSPELFDCRSATLTILTTESEKTTFGVAGARPLSQFLEVTILRDSRTIAKGANIKTARLFYNPDPVGDPGFIGEEILSCDDKSLSDPSVRLPRANKPCEDRTQRMAFPTKGTPKSPLLDPEQAADWRFVVYMYDNGRITN